MFRTKVVASLLLVSAFGVACGGKSKPAATAPLPEESATTEPAKPAEPAKPVEAPKPTPQPVSVTLPASTATVKLTKPGKGKKTPLKYVLAVGPAGGVDLTLDMDIKAGAMAQALSMKLGFSNEVLEVAADGTIKLKQKVTSASAEVKAADGKTTPEPLDPIVGTTIDATMSARGIPGERKVTTPPIEDPSMVQTLTQIPHLSIALPDKPVGAGATWEVTEPLGIEGINASVKTTYTLVSRKGKVATIEGKSTVSGGAEAGGADKQMQIQEIKGSGSSKFVLEEGKLLTSTDATQTLSIKVQMQDQAGKPQQMEMVWNTHITAASK